MKLLDVIFSLFCYVLSLRSKCSPIPLNLGIPVYESRLRKVVFKLLSVLFRGTKFFYICANIHVKQVSTIMSIQYPQYVTDGVGNVFNLSKPIDYVT
jgi:hypothetical protein